MYALLLALLFAGFFLTVRAQFPSQVAPIEAKPNGTVTITGDLAEGYSMPDLSWAANSAVACFPGTQNAKFSGNHVLFHTAMKTRCEMFIKVIPEDPNANMSIYAYQIGTNDFSLPTELRRCVSCEAEHKWDYPKAGRTQDHTREIRLNSVGNPYNIVIGVAGANGLAAGGFTLEVRMVGGEVEAPTVQEPVAVHALQAPKGQVTEVKGNLSQGVVIHDLSWASSSSVACFPGTQKAKFTGNHVLYRMEQPAYSTVKVTVIPDDPSANFSVYTYQVGANMEAVVPNLQRCVSCEAEHKWDMPKAGRTQDHTRVIENITAIQNPYGLYIGVVGANGLREGGYTLRVEVAGR